MQCSSPRASAGLSRLPASIEPSRRARADQRVHLVDEQDDLAFGALDLVEHGLEPLLELAAIFRAGDQRAHVERHQRAVLEAVGHVAIGDAQREAFGDRGLAGAGLADQHGVVLGPAGEDLDRAADFLVAADHRIELAVARRLGEVAGILLHRVVGFLRRWRCRRCARRVTSLDRGFERLGVDAGRLERLARRGGRCASASASSRRSTGDVSCRPPCRRAVRPGRARAPRRCRDPGVACAPPPETAGILASASSTSSTASSGLPPARWISLPAMPSLSSSSALSRCSGVIRWWFMRIATVCAICRKPLARSVNFSRFIECPSNPFRA